MPPVAALGVMVYVPAAALAAVPPLLVSVTVPTVSPFCRPAVVKALRPHTQKPFDVHLMISPVDPFLDAFAEAGADTITVHPEAGPHLHRTIQRIKGQGYFPTSVREQKNKQKAAAAEAEKAKPKKKKEMGFSIGGVKAKPRWARDNRGSPVTHGRILQRSGENQQCGQPGIGHEPSVAVDVRRLTSASLPSLARRNRLAELERFSFCLERLPTIYNFTFRIHIFDFFDFHSSEWGIASDAIP